MQLTVTIDGKPHVYHLDVSADQFVGKTHFHWRGVRFSAKVRNGEPKWKTEAEKYDCAAWPEGVQPTMRGRRQSISQERLRELNQSRRDEEARRKAESDLAKKRNAIVEKVREQLKLQPENKRDLPKLWAGQSVNFLTQTGKPQLCKYIDKHFITPGQKLEVG